MLKKDQAKLIHFASKDFYPLIDKILYVKKKKKTIEITTPL